MKWKYLLGVLAILTAFVTVSAQTPIDFDSAKWHDSFCYGEEICLTGNFDGIGGDDIVAFVRSSTGTDNDGNVWVALAGGDGFYSEAVWHDSFCYGEELCAVGDFNGDGRDDIAAFVRSSTGTDNDGNVWVALSDGRQFVDARIWHDNFCYGNEACLIGDFNGDGKDDIAAATGPDRDGNQADDVWVALSNGSSFVETRVWGAISGCELHDGNYSCMVGNFDGDKYDDIVSYDRNANQVQVISSNGNRFANEQLWLTPRQSVNMPSAAAYPYLCFVNGQTCAIGDFNDDGNDDIYTFTHETLADYQNSVFITASYGEPANPNPEENSGFMLGGLLVQDAFCIKGAICRVADVNDDNWADIVVFYRSLYPNDSLAGDVWVGINRRH